MKKAFLVLVAVLGFAFAASAQNHAQNNNLGVRLGGGQGYNAELSYQRVLGSNRIELDLGWANFEKISFAGLSAIYQFTFDVTKNFGLYVGPGARVDMALGVNDAAIGLALAGQGGMEYNFSAIPLQLSLDVRPYFYLIPATNFHWGDFALGIRYRF